MPGNGNSGRTAIQLSYGLGLGSQRGNGGNEFSPQTFMAWMTAWGRSSRSPSNTPLRHIVESRGNYDANWRDGRAAELRRPGRDKNDLGEPPVKWGRALAGSRVCPQALIESRSWCVPARTRRPRQARPSPARLLPTRVLLPTRSSGRVSSAHGHECRSGMCCSPVGWASTRRRVARGRESAAPSDSQDVRRRRRQPV